MIGKLFTCLSNNPIIDEINTIVTGTINEEVEGWHIYSAQNVRYMPRGVNNRIFPNIIGITVGDSSIQIISK